MPGRRAAKSPIDTPSLHSVVSDRLFAIVACQCCLKLTVVHLHAEQGKSRPEAGSRKAVRGQR